MRKGNWGGGRIMLGNNTSGRAVLLWPISFRVMEFGFHLFALYIHIVIYRTPTCADLPEGNYHEAGWITSIWQGVKVWVESSWIVMVHGDAREGNWRGNWRMECVASTLHTYTEHGVSSITTADALTSTASSRLNWRPCRFNWTRPFRRKTNSGFCACAITFQTQSNIQRLARKLISGPSPTAKTRLSSFDRTQSKVISLLTGP
jgi:hypothetical protein